VLADLGNEDQSRQLFTQAVTDLQQLGCTLDACDVLMAMAENSQEHQRYEEAARILDRCLQQLEPFNDHVRLGKINLQMGMQCVTATRWISLCLCCIVLYFMFLF